MNKVLAIALSWLIFSLSYVQALQVVETSVTSPSGIPYLTDTTANVTVSLFPNATDAATYAQSVVRIAQATSACTPGTSSDGQSILICKKNGVSGTTNPYLVSVSAPAEDGSTQTSRYAVFKDTTAPTLSSVVLNQVVGGLRISFSAKDTANAVTAAYSSADNYAEMRSKLTGGTLCGGLAFASVKLGSREIWNSTLSGCSQTIDVVAPLPAGSSSATAVLTVKDVFGRSATQAIALVVSTVAPAVTNISFVKDGASVTHISTSGLDVQVQAKTSATDVLVYVSKGEDNESVSVTRQGDFMSGSYRLSSPGSYIIYINATDSVGNSRIVSQAVTIALDDTAPSVRSVRGSVQNSGFTYVKSNDTIGIQFTEVGSGLLRASLDGVSASNCAGDQCVWHYYTFSNGNQTLALSAEDVAGNAMTGSVTITGDNLAPVVKSLQWNTSTLGSSGRAILHIQATDQTSMRVRVNFSALGAPTITEVVCPSNCTLTSPNLGVGPSRANLLVTVIDALNNSIVVIAPELTVLRTVSVVNVTYFDHSLKVSPGKVESSTSQYIKQKIYATVSLYPKTEFSTAKVLSSSFAGLTACRGDATRISTITRVASLDPSKVLLEIVLRTQDLSAVSNISFVCDVGLTGTYGDSYIEREIQQVNVTLPTFSVAVGELGASYEAEVQKAIDDALGLNDKIQSFKKLWSMAEKLCQLFNTFITISRVFSFTSSVLKGAGTMTMGTTTVAGIQMCSMQQAGESKFDWVKKGIGQKVGAVCKFVNCQWSLGSFVFEKAGVPGLEGKGGLPMERVLFGEVVQTQGQASSGSLGAQGALTMDTQNSLVFSVMNMCISGIIKNLDQWQQIKCRYAQCLKKDVPQGIPKSACETSKQYSECVYVFNQIFNSNPWTALYSYWVNVFKQMVSDPLAMAGVAIFAFACMGPCTAPDAGQTWTACKVVTVIKEVGAMVKEIQAISDNFKPERQENVNYCEGLE